MIAELLRTTKILPVLEVEDLAIAPELAIVLQRIGLTTIEVTMRHPSASQIVMAMKKAAPELSIGMGTVKSVEDIARAKDAGADFLVSPGASASLLSALAASSLPSLPGVATASEAMIAYEAGFSLVKFFPAEAAGGAAWLKAIRGPLPELSFCPTGGINIDKAPDYLALPNVVCVGGSWVASKALITARNWQAIEQNAKLIKAL
jgi:2-dehydro-3-deoxyphosphogluconate aldolase / (4S)-4-hydroxy-2-oxoglutarate aldolase